MCDQPGYRKRLTPVPHRVSDGWRDPRLVQPFPYRLPFLLNPVNPTIAEPNSHRADGTGTIAGIVSVTSDE
jgi:hypothetical protein